MVNMKIGLLTYHVEESPGATLQTYATCRAFEELGCDVRLIDLVHNNYNHGFIGWILMKPFYLVRDIRQRKFRSKFFPCFSTHYNTLDDLKKNPPKYDAYCVGSDQTWNKDIAGKNYMAYYLDFGGGFVKRFSYASSIGKNIWPIKDINDNSRIKELLKSFVGVSVRETTASNILMNEFEIKAEVVCDPVLLHDNYIEITGQIEPVNEIACFLFNKSKELLTSIVRIGTFYDAPLRMVLFQFPVKGYKYTYAPDTIRWLRYLVRSRFIVTDSFHGTVIAILYNKPFVVIYQKDSLISRIEDLLNKLELRDRLFSSIDEFRNSDRWKKTINWDKVNILLKEYRNESWDYLYSVLEKMCLSNSSN